MFLKSSHTTLPKIRLPYDDPMTVGRLAGALVYYLNQLNPDGLRELVFIGIGTDRSTGDSLGPLVGSKLRERVSGVKVFGTLDNPVHASNLHEHLRTLKNTSENPLVLAIDACLGQKESVGSVSLGEGPLRPGAGVHKELPSVGDMHITGVVNVGGYMEYMVLQNTRLSLVMRMADLIVDAIAMALQMASSDNSKIAAAQQVSC